MKNKDIVIPTFDPRMLIVKLASTGGDAFLSQIQPVSDIFHINRVEDYIRLVKTPSETDIHPFRLTVYNFIFLTKGRSIRSKSLSSYEFGENTFFFLPAYEITTHDSISEDYEGFYCDFSLDLLTMDYRLKDLLSDFPFLNFNSYPIVTIDDTARAFVLNILKRLETEYKKGKNCRLEILRTYLMALFTELKPFVTPPQYQTSNAALLVTEQFKNALSKHIYQKQKVSDYAEMLNVSPNHLNKCVKTTLDKSAYDLLSEMLVLEAKVLLKQSNLTISEIGYKIGRSDATDFARFFKTHAGSTPTEYRNKQ